MLTTSISFQWVHWSVWWSHFGWTFGLQPTKAGPRHPCSCWSSTGLLVSCLHYFNSLTYRVLAGHTPCYLNNPLKVYMTPCPLYCTCEHHLAKLSIEPQQSRLYSYLHFYLNQSRGNPSPSKTSGRAPALQTSESILLPHDQVQKIEEGKKISG